MRRGVSSKEEGIGSNEEGVSSSDKGIVPREAEGRGPGVGSNELMRVGAGVRP